MGYRDARNERNGYATEFYETDSERHFVAVVASVAVQKSDETCGENPIAVPPLSSATANNAPMPIPQLTKSAKPNSGKDTLVILSDTSELRNIDLVRNDRQYILEQLKGDGPALCDISGRLVMVHQIKKGDRSKQLEQARVAGNTMALKLIAMKRESAQVISLQNDAEATLAFVEGAVLGSYVFTAL
ncbi:MAG: hypothetical protein IPL86_12665 [Flavobacteriales bacterium]|nr:hypothetical protein [Flavobacteriales bacterium]